MELIIGGAYQGKLTYAAEKYQFKPEDICDLARGELMAGKRCYTHLEALSRRGEVEDACRQALLAAEAVLSREIGAGVVPMNRDERAWRERHGKLLQELAASAACVTRVFCGLTEELK